MMPGHKVIDGNTSVGWQRGIDVSGHMSAANAYTQCMVGGNELKGAGTHTNESMVFLSNNLGLHSPSVACNIVHSGYNGFEINMPNYVNNVPGLLWRTNDMYPMEQGLVLSQNGGMGQQGDPTTSSSNLWIGSWTGGVHTYVDVNSDAGNSKLYIKTCATCSPTIHGGPVLIQRYSQAGNLVPVNAGAADHNCFNEPNGIATPYPEDEIYYTEGMAYIAKTANYRFLHFNDSIRESDAIHSGYYDNLEGSSIQKFIQVEQYLYDGDYSAALVVLAEIEPNVTVESNYINYFTIYANYLSGHGLLSEADSIALYALCLLCPGYDGACIYQARALYNSIYQIVIEGGNCSEEEYSARKANTDSTKFVVPGKKWDVTIFPNPATEQLIVYSTTSPERLLVTIYDISGRIIKKETLQLADHHCNLKFKLDNGIYFLSVTKTDNETITKKIIISK